MYFCHSCQLVELAIAVVIFLKTEKWKKFDKKMASLRTVELATLLCIMLAYQAPSECKLVCLQYNASTCTPPASLLPHAFCGQSSNEDTEVAEEHHNKKTDRCGEKSTQERKEVSQNSRKCIERDTGCGVVRTTDVSSPRSPREGHHGGSPSVSDSITTEREHQDGASSSPLELPQSAQQNKMPEPDLPGWMQLSDLLDVLTAGPRVAYEALSSVSGLSVGKIHAKLGLAGPGTVPDACRRWWDATVRADRVDLAAVAVDALILYLEEELEVGGCWSLIIKYLCSIMEWSDQRSVIVV